jgi:tripartite-type tricarboxylate transporter receptor subunit TctC
LSRIEMLGLRIACVAIVAAGLLAPGAAHAQSYPTRPVKLIVPFAAGGPIDVMGRLVAQWFTSYSWTGLLAPAGTPAQIVDRLNGAINQGLQSAELNSNLGRLGAEAKAGSPQDFAAFTAEETQKWGAIVKASGVKLD